jgi:hypothetical protein
MAGEEGEGRKGGRKEGSKGRGGCIREVDNGGRQTEAGRRNDTTFLN